ncbi:SRPBCC domain-containing protein [Lysinimonas soli]|uniref:SRPBCC domain-containing protein n=1 Tax=Lysinimonas soli TaxID=1074233 RepID=A0ABW0NQ63_9MICO
MTIERRLARAGFTLTRDYPVPVERVWNAFADEAQKLAWFGSDDAFDQGEWAFDFRVGGRDVAEGKFHDGPLSRFEGTYTDIVEHVRIVNTYDMWLDGVHMSTSVASFEFDPIESIDGPGTRFTHVEHGVFFDQFWADGPNREAGTRGVLEKLGRYLTSSAI